MPLDLPLQFLRASLLIAPSRLRKWLFEAIHGLARREALRPYLLGDRIVSDGVLKGTVVSAPSSWNDGLDRFSLIAGYYEKEVLDKLDVLLSRIKTDPSWKQISGSPALLHLGCSDGVIAAGFAKRYPSLTVYAVDQAGAALNETQVHANLNGVSDQVKIFSSLSDALVPLKLHSLVIALVDVEGSEYELVPLLVQNLSNIGGLVIETHQEDSTRREQAESLLSLLRRGFHVEQLIWAPSLAPVSNWEYSESLSRLSDYQRFLLLSEGRSHVQTFLYCSRV